MEIILLFIVAAFIGLFLRGSGGRKYEAPQSSMPDPSIFKHYELQPSLFVNASEQAFFLALEAQLPPQFRLQTKTRLEDIIGVRKDLANRKLAFQLRGRVKSRHIDFLIINQNGQPCYAIELDGRSHKNSRAAAGDALKDGLCRAAGLPLQRVKTGESFAQVARDIALKL